MSRLKNFDNRALVHHADHLLPVMRRLVSERTLHSVSYAAGLSEREPKVLKKLLSRAAKEPEVRDTEDPQEVVEALHIWCRRSRKKTDDPA